MGCWNETCMISNLPITVGDKVAMTILTKNEDGEWYKPNSLYYISPIMFYGEYNDYGSAESCYGLGLEFTADEFRKYYTQIDAELTPDALVQKFSREELQFHNVTTFKAKLMGMEDTDSLARLGFIRKDILDSILDDYSWEQTFYDKNENNSFNYHTINYQYLLDNIPDSIRVYKKYYAKEREMEKALGKPSTTLMFHQVPDPGMRNTNVLTMWVFAHDRESREHPFHKSIGEKIQELAEADKDEELTLFLTEFAKYSILYKFMSETRKVFTPQPNVSQDSDTAALQLFANIITTVAKKHDARYADDEYPDDAWDHKRQLFMEQGELDLA